MSILFSNWLITVIESTAEISTRTISFFTYCDIVLPQWVYSKKKFDYRPLKVFQLE